MPERYERRDTRDIGRVAHSSGGRDRSSAAAASQGTSKLARQLLEARKRQGRIFLPS